MGTVYDHTTLKFYVTIRSSSSSSSSISSTSLSSSSISSSLSVSASSSSTSASSSCTPQWIETIGTTNWSASGIGIWNESESRFETEDSDGQYILDLYPVRGSVVDGQIATARITILSPDEDATIDYYLITDRNDFGVAGSLFMPDVPLSGGDFTPNKFIIEPAWRDDDLKTIRIVGGFGGEGSYELYVTSLEYYEYCSSSSVSSTSVSSSSSAAEPSPS
jgi:hypothetical protein